MAKSRGREPGKVSKGDLETLQSEYSAVVRKLESKDEALHILRRELELCQEEKEEYTRLIQHMKGYFVTSTLSQLSSEQNSVEDKETSEGISRIEQLENQLHQVKQRHKLEMEDHQQKLVLLRGAMSPSPSVSNVDREKLLSQLEAMQGQVTSLERQVQTLEDEKEELLSERDYFSSRCNTLNKCLEEGDHKKPSQSVLEEILEENRQLKMQLLDVQAERDNALNKIERYQRAVERRKAREARIQALESLAPDKLYDLRQSVKRAQEVESLANSLAEEVKEKALALVHQKKTNKLLASRITELEHRLKVLEISGLWSTTHNQDGESDTSSAAEKGQSQEESSTVGGHGRQWALAQNNKSSSSGNIHVTDDSYTQSHSSSSFQH